jgi:plasmid stabilization system protein ParE
MNRLVRWTTRAATQLQDTAVYLEEARPGTGSHFVDDVEAILLVAAEHPKAFPRVPRVEGDDVRRALVRKYSYWIIYEIRRDHLLVLSVWHGTREPDRWRQD